MTRTFRASRRTRILATLAAVSAVWIAAVLLIDRSDGETQAAQRHPPAGAVIRPDSHRLSSVADGRVTFVEFLDFECEACAAMFPVVERLRHEYGDRVSFVVRYFPIPAHFNAERAARAVEAAARQGRFEQMYQRMYQTQSGWGDQRVPLDSVFRGFAAELGLDLAAFDTDYNDPATLARVRADFEDGRALGVDGTPTFFVNDTRIKPSSYQDLVDTLDTALR
ncbi:MULTISPECIES: DsbA family protein [Nocardia]|uniref:DsbA family protein n=1 Tax=Nocardia TaxID=1817 RepID=UPI0005C19453|nr:MULTISPECIES: thioredoxin domain-containing protein [Nocardia]